MTFSPADVLRLKGMGIADELRPVVASEQLVERVNRIGFKDTTHNEPGEGASQRTRSSPLADQGRAVRETSRPLAKMTREDMLENYCAGMLDETRRANAQLDAMRLRCAAQLQETMRVTRVNWRLVWLAFAGWCVALGFIAAEVWRGL